MAPWKSPFLFPESCLQEVPDENQGWHLGSKGFQQFRFFQDLGFGQDIQMFSAFPEFPAFQEVTAGHGRFVVTEMEQGAVAVKMKPDLWKGVFLEAADGILIGFSRPGSEGQVPGKAGLGCSSS